MKDSVEPVRRLWERRPEAVEVQRMEVSRKAEVVVVEGLKRLGVGWFGGEMEVGSGGGSLPYFLLTA